MDYLLKTMRYVGTMSDGAKVGAVRWLPSIKPTLPLSPLTIVPCTPPTLLISADRALGFRFYRFEPIFADS